MALFSNGNKKAVKSKQEKAKKARVRIRGPSVGNVETVVEVKTVNDIPPALEARRLIGENELVEAARVTYNAARKDYARYFGAKSRETEGNRQFFVSELLSMNIKVPEYGYVDNFTLLETFDQASPKDETGKNRLGALKKILSFYLNFYERARFASEITFDGDELINRFSEIYNYMDITRLYFSGKDLKVS